MRNFRALLFLISINILVGCTTDSMHVNDAIDSVNREKIRILNRKIIEALSKNNPIELKEVFSDELKNESDAKLAFFVATLSGRFKKKNYSLLDEYLVNNSELDKTQVAQKEISGNAMYKINFPYRTKQTYISLMINSTPQKSDLVTCVYGKYGNDWKLIVLKIGDFSFFGKTAIDFYKEAQENYLKGNLVDAINDIGMLKRTIDPAEGMFKYQNTDVMLEFSNKVLNEAKTKILLPMKIEEIKTKPQILSVGPLAMEEGIYPLVSYLSQINLKDTIALKEENNALKSIIGKKLPGMDLKKKYIFFKAYNKIPDGKHLFESYGFSLKN